MAHSKRIAITILSSFLTSALGVAAARAQPGETPPGAAAPAPIRVEPEVDETRFGPAVTGWHADAGADLRRLDPEDFYQRVGRPDLVDAYAGRRQRAIAGTVAGVALIGVSVYFLSRAIAGAIPNPDCGPMQGDGWFACEQAANDAAFSHSTRDAGLGAGAFIGGAIALGIGGYYFARPQPISADEASALADRYNRTHVVPYVGADGAGVTAVGRF